MIVRRSTALRIGLVITALIGLACGPGKSNGGKEEERPAVRHGCTGSGRAGNGGDEGELWLTAVVCAVRTDDVGAVKPFTRRVRVVISAFDQKGRPGVWVDTPQNGPVPRPYPKDTQEVTPYRHPIFFDPRTRITASISATLLGRQGEFIECWFEDMSGAELVGTYNMAGVEKVGKNGNGSTTVHCNTTFSG